MNRQINFCKTFGFREDIRENSQKYMCPHSHWLPRHCPAWLLTTPTPCQRSQQLHGRRASVVNDYKNPFQRSQWLRRHRVNYFTLEKEKLRTKVTKNEILYFWKFGVSIVINYMDTCWNSCWLQRHDVGVVNNYADTTMTTRTLLEKLWRLLTDFKGTVSQKSIWVCLNIQ